MRLSLSLAAAVLALHLALALPGHPAALDAAALLGWPAELPLLLLALAAAPNRAAGAARLLVTGCLAAMLAVKLADLASHAVFLRPFDPLLDRHLLGSGWQLLRGAAGVPAALAAIIAAAGVLGLATALLWRATGRVAAAAAGRRRPAAAALAACALLLAAGQLPGTAGTARLAAEHVRSLRDGQAELALFREEAARDPQAGAPLAGLAGRDVAIVFVESYGRSALESPRFAATVDGILAGAEADLAGRGLAMRSAWLTSPVAGGQSWLAHATLLSGLRIDSQARYRALVASPRRTLPAIAAADGWRSVAVAPAITLPWPEAGYFGYRTLLDAHGLGYRGVPFGWVTMPDQYTLAVLARRLGERPRPPVFALVALISSHAPWAPPPPLLDWEAIGDGSVFDAAMAAGEAPESIWRDPERVRTHYRDALAYTLAATAGFLARQGDAPALAIVLGDHQPASLIAEGFGGLEVPVHVVGPPDLVSRLDAWGWAPGLRPGAESPVWPMQAFRDRFLAAFAHPGAAAWALPAVAPR